MKTYVLTISKTFPVKHKKAGQPTNYQYLIQQFTKRHTIRSNFDLWKKRIDEVNEGKACISLRQWEGKPYNSKQVELWQYWGKEIGYQMLEFSASGLNGMIMIDKGFPEQGSYHIEEIAKNDGLSEDDFRDWFKGYDLSKPMIIIHFTNFRY